MFSFNKSFLIFNPLEQFEINTPIWYFSNFFSNITKITADINTNTVYFNQFNSFNKNIINSSDNFTYFLDIKNSLTSYNENLALTTNFEMFNIMWWNFFPEEFFPGIRLEGNSSYFVQNCRDLTPDEQQKVKDDFAKLLTDEGICINRQTKVNMSFLE